MTQEDFKARVSMAYEGREQWEAFLNRVWSIHTSELPHWISVEDELPPLEIVSESWETSDDVLVYTLSCDILVSRYEFDKLTQEHYWVFSDHDYIVTHWMPLPQAPVLSKMEKTLSEDYCSYELAKLLKEKGFDCWCEHYIFENYEDYKSEGTGRPTNWNKYGGHTSIPSLSLAMKWLREVHKLFIVIEPEYFEAGRVIAYDFSVWCGDNYKHNFKDYPTFEEAVEAAIKYSLENLI